MSEAPVLALDGPAAAGKTVVGRAVAQRLGWQFFDTGVLYRALTWKALRDGVDPDDAEALACLAARVRIEVNPSADPERRPYDVRVDGVDVADEIRSPRVDGTVSRVSAHESVRAALQPAQRALARMPGVVVAGRDIGTVIFPRALAKVFLDASPGVRAHRRVLERGAVGQDAQAMEAALVERDQQDRHRATAPLRPADDAVVLNTDDLSVDEVIARVLDLVQGARRER